MEARRWGRLPADDRFRRRIPRQTRGPIQEPAGIPVVKDGMKSLGSPFSPEYHHAWYQSQANRIAAMAWMEHDIAMRQAYIAELAARKMEADALAKAEKADKAGEDMNGKVMWTKVGKPAGWGLGIGKGKIISSTPIPESKMVVDATPVKMDSKSTIVVESPKMTIKDATPMPTDKVDRFNAGRQGRPRHRDLRDLLRGQAGRHDGRNEALQGRQDHHHRPRHPACRRCLATVEDLDEAVSRSQWSVASGQ